MTKKFIIVVLVGSLFLLLNIGITGFPIEESSLIENNIYNSIQESEENLSNWQDTIVDKESVINYPSTFTNYANAGKPYSGKIGELIQFDATNSYINSIEIESYEWDFGDGVAGNGINPVHSYSVAGTYYTLLTIRCTNGETFQDIAPVYIDQNNDHLKPYGGCFYYGEKDESILFDASKSICTNPGTKITQWIWDFGDGKTKKGEKVTYSYSEEKVYLVTLEITDSNGEERKDVLHADIGVSYSSIRDFFINCNPKFKSIFDILLNNIGSSILYPLLFVNIYTNYNGYEETISLSSDHMLPLTIDVNHDGDGDIVVNEISFFKPVLTQSQFNEFPWFAFETTISDIERISEDITDDDDFSIALQFSLQIMEDFLEVDEPVIRIGYHSAIGEEKPSKFSATHVFRPYILPRMLKGGSTVQNKCENSNMYSVVQKAKGNILQQPTIKPLNSIKSKNEELAAEKKTHQLIDTDNEIGRGRKLITENGIRLDSSNANSFALFISFSNVAATTSTIVKVSFESITTTTLMYRKGDVNRDLHIQGSDNSAVTLSITRKNANGNATVGLFINPLQSFGFHIDIYKLENGARQVNFNIENPPENLILFTENEDSEGSQDALYFYLRNVSQTIEFEWLPRLDNGYISLSKDLSSDGMEVGICNDLKNPTSNIYITNLPATTSINWEISKVLPRSITFTSETDGLTLNAELTNITQKNQTINFYATSNDDLDIKIHWSLPEGYFELQRSTKNIDFDFHLLQDNIQLNITGSYIGGPEDGFKIQFIDFYQGILEVVSDKALTLDIFAKNPWTKATLSTGLAFSTGGNVQLEWDESLNVNIDADASIGVNNFSLDSLVGSVTTEQITLDGTAKFDLDLDGSSQLQLSGNGQFSLLNFKGEIGQWSSEIHSASTGGGLDILLKPKDKVYQVISNYSINIQGFDTEYDGSGEINDMNFEIDYFDMYSKGKTWFDFSTGTPKFQFEGKDVVDINNLHLSIGSGSSSVINFTILAAHLDSDGSIYGEWNNDYLFVNADVDFNWDLDISTLNYGSWIAQGTFEGSASMNAEWNSDSGDIEFKIGDSGIYHSLEITHDDQTVNLGNFNFESGNISFEWQREQTASNGYFNIINDGVTGSLTVCNISRKNLPNPFEFYLGDIEVNTGNLSMDWARRTTEKMLYINNEMSVDMDLIKINWDGKKVILGDLSLHPGEFKFSWNVADKQITLNNGIPGLGPTISYENNDRKLSVSLLNLQNDYSKTITLKWFEERNSNISGLYIDTDDTNLVKWIVFQSITYNSSGNKGRKLALNGLRANNFKIIKNLDDNLEMTGRIYIANNLTYSKLVNDEWKDLNIQWNLNLDGIGNIEFDIDPTFTLDAEISAQFSGVDINTTFDLPQYLKFGWDVDFDGNGHISIDTNSEEIFEIDFKLSKDTQSYQPKWGLHITAAGLKAEDYRIYWDFSLPPGQWVLGESGYIEPGSLNQIYLAWNGNWYNLLSGGTPV